MQVRTKTKESTVKRSIFKLGRLVFSIKNCDASFERELDALLPPYTFNPAVDHVQLINTGCVTDVREVFNHILKKHYKCVWISASCLLSPAGHSVLIAGPSGAGKSTLAMGLAIGHSWKVVSEDLVLIDFETNEVINFPLPFLIRSGTIQLISEAIGSTALNVDLKEGWQSLGDLAAKENCSPNFDRVFILGSWHPQVKTEEISAGACVRKLLGLSNLLKRKNSVEKLTSIFDKSKCFHLIGGTVGERADFILNACK